MNTLEKIEKALSFLNGKIPDFPEIVIVTGSGLAGLAEQLEVEIVLNYQEIPGFRISTVQGHPGRLVIGKLNRQRVAFMQGRIHYYEGYTMEEVVLPFRVLAQAGASIFVLTNASGSLHSNIIPTDLVLMTDHINLMGTNPLVGKNFDELGARFPDMTHLYDLELCECVRFVAKKLDISLKEGVYVGLHGPSYETPAEIRMYKAFGDIVGMSTVPEAIAIHHMGRRVVAISCVTNFAAGVSDSPLIHDEVLENAKRAYGKFSALVCELVATVGEKNA